MKYTKTEAVVALLVISGLLIIGYFHYQKTKYERRSIAMNKATPPGPPLPLPPGSSRVITAAEIEAFEASKKSGQAPVGDLMISGRIYPPIGPSKDKPQAESFKTFLRARMLGREKFPRSITVEFDQKAHRINVVVPNSASNPSDTVHSLTFEEAKNLAEDLSQMLECWGPQ
jgi:hypothetical protein